MKNEIETPYERLVMKAEVKERLDACVDVEEKGRGLESEIVV